MKELNQGEPRTYFVVEIFKSFEVFSWEQGRASNYSVGRKRDLGSQTHQSYDLGKSSVTLLGLLLPSHQTQYASPLCSNPLWLIKYVTLQETEAPRRRLIKFYLDSQYKNLWKKKGIALLCDWSGNWLVPSHTTYKLSKYPQGSKVLMTILVYTDIGAAYCEVR